MPDRPIYVNYHPRTATTPPPDTRPVLPWRKTFEMDEGLSDASKGERPQEPANVRLKRTRQQPARLEDEMVGGKGQIKSQKKPKDTPSGVEKINGWRQ